MSEILCTPVIKGIDDVICRNVEYFKGMPLPVVASARALFDATSGEVLLDPDTNYTEDQIIHAGEMLGKFLENTGEEEYNKMTGSAVNLASSVSIVERAYPSSRNRNQAVSRIAQAVSKKARALQKEANAPKTTVGKDGKPKQVTPRQRTVLEILNGFKNSSNQVMYGEKAIFSAVYQDFLQTYFEMAEAHEYNTQIEAGDYTDKEKKEKKKPFDKEAFEELQRMLANWGSLCALSRTVLKRTEGLQLGLHNSYAKKASIEDVEEIVEISLEFDPENNTKESYQENKERKSAFNSLTQEVKSVISRIPTGKQDVLGFDIYYSPYEVSSTILDNCIGCTSTSSMKTALKEAMLLGEEYSNVLGPVIHLLENDSKLASLFFINFKRGFSEYFEAEVSDKGLRMKSLNTAYATPLDEWRYAARTNSLNVSTSAVFRTDESGKIYVKNEDRLIVNSEEINDIVKESMIAVNRAFAKRKINGLESFTKLNEDGSNAELISIGQYFRNFGIQLADSDIWTLYRKGKLREALKNVLELHTPEVTSPFARQEETTSLADLLHPSVRSNKSFTAVIYKTFKTINNALGLQKIESHARIMSKTGDQTTVYSHQLPNYITNLIDPIKRIAQSAEDRAQKINAYLDSRYGESTFFKRDGIWRNRWLKDLTDPYSDFIDNFNHYILAQTNVNGRTNSAEKLTTKEHALALLSAFFSKQGIQYADYPVFILGDSGKLRFLTAPIYSENEIIDGLYQLTLQEIEHHQMSKAVDHALRSGKLGPSKYHDGLPFLNEQFECLKFLNREIVDRLLRGEQLAESQIKEAIRAGLDAKVVEKTQKFKDLGVLNKFSDYVTPKKSLEAVIREYVINNMFAMSQQLQLFTVSPAYYKDIEDLQKRYKEVHTNGTPLDVESYAKERGGNPYQRVVYFDDIIINSELNHPKYYDFLSGQEQLKNHTGKYTENSLTDGQAYRTIDSYRYVATAQGLWTEEQEQLYRVLVHVRNGKLKITDPRVVNLLKALQASIQPQKPYLFTWEKVNYHDADLGADNTLYIPVQHKCAEVILIPELIAPNTPLRALAELMVEQNIDVAASTTAVKVGGFGATDIVYKTDPETGLYVNGEGEIILNKDGEMPSSKKEQKENPNFGKVVEGSHPNMYMPVSLTAGSDYNAVKANLSEAFGKGYVHELHMQDYVRQQNVPEHTHDSRAMGTQVRKMPLLGLKMDGDYSSYLPQSVSKFKVSDKVSLSFGAGVGGRNFAMVYSSLIAANIMDSLDSLMKDVLKDSDLSKILQQLALNGNDLLISDLLNYTLTGDEKFLTPLFEGSISKDVTSKLLSLFRKRVNHQLICGGSAVQASAWGIKEIQEDGTTPEDGGLDFLYDKDGNPIGAQCQITWNFKYTNSAGAEVSLDYNEYCNEDGTLKLVDKDDPSKGTLLETRFPGITDIVAYRIPTESDYSIWLLKAVKFARPEEGGIIRLPAEVTTVSGADFKQYWSH